MEKNHIFLRIILPLSKPVFAVLGILGFTAIWMNFLWPLIICQKLEMWTFTVALYNFQESNQLNALGPNVIMAASVICIIPTMIVFFVFQRFIQKGISLTGIKG